MVCNTPPDLSSVKGMLCNESCVCIVPYAFSVISTWFMFCVKCVSRGMSMDKNKRKHYVGVFHY